MADLKNLTDYNMDDVQDPTAVEAGEYKIRIIDFGDGVREAESGNPFIMPRFEIVGEPLAKDFNNYLGLPYEGMDAKKLQRCLAQLKNFCIAFGITFDILNACIATNEFEELLGLEGWALLSKKDDPEYGEQNGIKKFVLGA